MRWNYFRTFGLLCVVLALLRSAIAWFDNGKWEAGLGAFVVMLMIGGPICIAADFIAWRRERGAQSRLARQAREPHPSP